MAVQLRNLLPSEKKETGIDYLAEQFPWYPMAHLLRAAEHPNDPDLLQKAALYFPDPVRLMVWMHQQKKEDQDNLPVKLPAKASNKTDQDTAAEIHVLETPLHPLPEPATNLPDRVAQQDVPSDHKPVDESQGFTEGIPTEQLPAPAQEAIPFLPDTQETDALEELLPITPYHTVDYFASQGIQTDKTATSEKDTQLDKQVKSFTEWLKSMKKLKYQPATTYTDPLVDAKAKASIHQKEVITEAMAEVWAKQGDIAHAAQIYANLMLLHPEKTPYFAARLQELKEKP